MSQMYVPAFALANDEVEEIRAVLGEATGIPYNKVAPIMEALDAASPTNYEYMETRPETILVNLLFQIGLGVIPIHNAKIQINGATIEIDDGQVVYNDRAMLYSRDDAPGEIARIFRDIIEEERAKLDEIEAQKLADSDARDENQS